jgi:malate dehydrogenase (oxaloacetate-decarboxylating)
MDYAQLSLQRHRELKGKLSVIPKQPIRTRDDLSTFYTPGIAAVSRAIAENPDNIWEYTIRGNTVAVVSDGTAVLGLGDIGPEAAQPVMAGKAVLFKEFADIDAFPLVLRTGSTEELIATIKALAPSFGGINLEDIAAPRCFAVETALQDLGIPVMHDDQHGTAVVVVAGLINACRVTGKDLAGAKIVMNGAGAAGVAITKLLTAYLKETAPGQPLDLIAVDRTGIIHPGRENLNASKAELATLTNPRRLSGSLADALRGADIFLGVSTANALSAELVPTMAAEPIIFAMANPVPEIMPDTARKSGAALVATGRSDYPNQVNNVLAFPGIFRGALDCGAVRITQGMLLAAARALAGHLPQPDQDHILPDPLDRSVAHNIARAVAAQARKEGVCRHL